MFVSKTPFVSSIQRWWNRLIVICNAHTQIRNSSQGKHHSVGKTEYFIALTQFFIFFLLVCEIFSIWLDDMLNFHLQQAMKNILLLFAKLNPAIRYVQGMNEVLAPIYYVFSTDTDEKNAVRLPLDFLSDRSIC